MNTLIEQLVNHGGIVQLDDFPPLNSSTAILEFIDELKEDLLQVSFPGNQMIDIGWYPEFCENGSFRVVLISGPGWDHPTFSKDTKTWTGLEIAITEALTLINPERPQGNFATALPIKASLNKREKHD